MMMWHKVLRGSILGLCVITLVGCGDDSPLASASSPTGPSAAPSVNLTGSWSGMMRDEGGQNPDQGAPAGWTATQTGNSVSGPFQLKIDEDETGDRIIRGTLSGTLSGTQASLTMSFPAGTFAEEPACAISGLGTSTPTSSSLTTLFAMTLTPACDRIIDDGLKPQRLTLEKQ